jgi:hypothetical protein
MPPQLRRGLKNRRRNSEPKPIVEQLPRIDIADLCRFRVFPSQYEWHKDHYLEMPFRYPFVKSLVISLQNIEFNHVSGYNQIVPLRWCKTGFGGNYRPRPLFICRCGHSVTKLYFTYGSLKCRRCTKAVYASQVLDKRTRPILQSIRLHSFIKALPPKVRRITKAKLNARHQTLTKQAQGIALKSARIDNKAKHIQSNYQLQTTPHWR